MIRIKVHNGDDVQVYSFEKDTPKEDIKAALIADKHESSTLDIREEVRGEMREGVESNPIRPLLDLVASKEASVHGYNQVNGPRNRDNLTEMTLAEVMKKQEDDVYMNMEGASSNAVGRYQFIPSTLEEAMRRANLSPNDLMNEENQDKMAAALLEKRGLSRYTRGELTREDFANNLAKEWASFPLVSGDRRGESYYSSVGNNQARVDPDTMLSVIDRVGEFGELFTPRGSKLKVSEVVPEYFEGLTSDTPRGSTPGTTTERTASDTPSRTNEVSSVNLPDYDFGPAPVPTTTQSSNTKPTIRAPKPQPIKQSPRFRASTTGIDSEMAALTSAKGNINDSTALSTTGKSNEQGPLGIFDKPEFRGGSPKTTGYGGTGLV